MNNLFSAFDIVHRYIALSKPNVQLANLSLFKKTSSQINYDDPVGLADYSYFEKCKIDKNILQAIEYEVNSKALAHLSIVEELSAYWLIHSSNRITEPELKHTLLKMGTEEYEHFLFFTNLLINNFSDIDAAKLVQDMRNLIFDHNIDTKPIEEFIAIHCIGEAIIPSELKHLYKNTTNEYMRNTLKVVLSQEANHAIAARQFKPLLNNINNNKPKIIIYMLAQIVVNSGFGFTYCRYKEALADHGIDYETMKKEIKQSRRSKDVVISTVEELFQLAKTLNYADEDFDKFLYQSKIANSYKEYTQ